jgi:beta-N-acetylhexosaminidase
MKEVGQLMMIGISGLTLTDDEKKFIVKNNISGVTLFARNCKDPDQIRELCKEIQSLRHQMPDRAPLFIGIDQEGGRVMRLKAPFTQWPALKKLGEIDSPTVSFQLAQCMGLEMKAVGINLDYAPCADIFTNPKNTVIGDRAVSSDAEIVAKHVSALIRGYVKAGIIPCVKHFPGHGNTLIDSHEDLPIEQADLQRLLEVELVPFKKACKSRIDMVMTSHIRFEKVDATYPVTLSEIFIKKILREECRFRGIVVTDDLGMKALSKNFPAENIPVRALQAGCDLLLYCNEPEVPPIALQAIEKALVDGQLDKSEISGISQKILMVKKESIPQPDPIDRQSAAKIIGNSEHFKLAQAIASGSVPLTS